MTPQERQAAFNALFNSLPGKNVERLRAVAAALFCKENTVRIWRLARPPRVIPEAKLRILQATLTKV